jgi:hypothetical protein
MTIGPHLLGRTVEHDPRNFDFLHPIRKATGPLRSVTHTLAMPHLNQGNVGSCEGNTLMEFLGCAKAINNRKAYNRKRSHRVAAYPTEFDALDAYSLATTLDDDGIPGHYPPEDTGTSGVGIAKAGQELGGIGRYNWTRTFDAFRATLQTQPIMLGLNWYDSMFEYNGAGWVYGPTSSDQPSGGHAILAYAWRPPTPKLRSHTGCTNHWVQRDGTPWGVRIGEHDGSFWIADDLLEQLLIREQGDSLVPVLM